MLRYIIMLILGLPCAIILAISLFHGPFGENVVLRLGGLLLLLLLSAYAIIEIRRIHRTA